jgi:hypothetical protein
MREGFELRRERHSRFVRRDIAAALRTTGGVDEPAPANLLTMLADLERRLRDGERERLYAEVDRGIDELLQAARCTRGSDGVSP